MKAKCSKNNRCALLECDKCFKMIKLPLLKPFEKEMRAAWKELGISMDSKSRAGGADKFDWEEEYKDVKEFMK